MIRKRVKQIDPLFEDFVNNMRRKASKDMGLELNFKQTTRMVAKVMAGLDLNFNLEEKPKSRMQKLEMEVKRRKRKKRI